MTASGKEIVRKIPYSGTEQKITLLFKGCEISVQWFEKCLTQCMLKKNTNEKQIVGTILISKYLSILATLNIPWTQDESGG